ncbi:MULTISPECIES: hypothetical protein [unclassified Sulfuricurvum]|uniref:hypothetical protein n=1 Tax=unclassified Sulfuricurvum TaxID=2632390 RepID=UPI0002998A50|nr:MULTISPECIES: hypothetical protein [unclassified Sulfuricurvum]OHD83399.1 MAG: hypothetical protein A3J39_08005 [Sulfuricurvum sp. RIFCSPHIGHO2_12_FULL_44_8]OHD83753.1 MAG: hypothetical protein A3D90_04075 [Sulfuricurvum sp. RIFCSPHIGHO2_02_FULL_43_9]OHD86475.1 MAG: hypothetical protein A3I60_01330 [Sulfuricurvum sp. RIFCSPLOWO2_02_FULL_43_45]OHD87085.1 MAG: hypothetical protein A2Y52_02010 [Sulfuricurvum sp. RIFCSPLOWO2_02_43_6]AFV98517.1 hypothetical protein B649_11030 [Candidatus Sulfuri
MYRMTYNHSGVTGCSARGIAKRESEKELQELAEQLKDSICNIRIEKVKDDMDQHLPMDVFINMKELR